jgi:hypothetical protein
MQYPVAITRIPEPFQGQYFAHSTDSAVQKIMKSVNGRTRIMPMGRWAPLDLTKSICDKL